MDYTCYPAGGCDTTMDVILQRRIAMNSETSSPNIVEGVNQLYEAETYLTSDQIVLIKPGEYLLPETLILPDGIVLKAETDAEKPLLLCESDAVGIELRGSVTITDVIIKAPKGMGINFTGVSQSGQNRQVIIKNCEFETLEEAVRLVNTTGEISDCRITRSPTDTETDNTEAKGLEKNSGIETGSQISSQSPALQSEEAGSESPQPANKFSGISLYRCGIQNSPIKLLRNTIQGWNDCGCSAYQSELEMEENIFQNNKEDGALIAQCAAVTISKQNKFITNHSNGLSVYQSSLDITDNIFEENHCHGLMIAQKSTGTVTGNHFKGNGKKESESKYSASAFYKSEIIISRNEFSVNREAHGILLAQPETGNKKFNTHEVKESNKFDWTHKGCEIDFLTFH